MRILLVDPPGALPTGTCGYLSGTGCTVDRPDSYARAAAQLCEQPYDAIIFTGPTPSPTADSSWQFEQLLRVAEARRIGGVLVTAGPLNLNLAQPTLINVVGCEIREAHIHELLIATSGYRSLVQSMERELQSMSRLGDRLKQHFLEVDQEMRLAGRLQRDFLPRNIESIGPVRFSSVFRPASWVSGDIYDVFRVDERHVAFYVADAVGHGMAASLLTMFIKRSVVPKRIDGNNYRVLDPCETMAALNEALSGQDLPHCQFVTACYCLLNTETLELRYARGGHPYPFHLSQGQLSELKTEGALLGLFKGEEFPTFTTHLKPGDKIILYTDGIEGAVTLGSASHPQWVTYVDMFRELGTLPVAELGARLDAILDIRHGSLHPQDDVTVLACEVAL